MPDPLDVAAIRACAKMECGCGCRCAEHLDAVGDIPILLARVEALRCAVAAIGVPLEVLRAQIAAKPYAEMTWDFQQDIIAASERARTALGGTDA